LSCLVLCFVAVGGGDEPGRGSESGRNEKPLVETKNLWSKRHTTQKQGDRRRGENRAKETTKKEKERQQLKKMMNELEEETCKRPTIV